MSLEHFLYRFKYRFAKNLPLSKPVDVSLELASICNQRCGYCYHADQTNLPFVKGMMTYDTAYQIVKEAAFLEVPAIKFNWKGESTINPIFPKITYVAKRFASSSRFIDRITNSNFKFNTGDEEIFLGLCNQTKVKVSFDSFIKDVMETQRAGSNHELALKNIDKFYNHKKRKDTELVIQAVRTKLNKDEDLEGEIKKRWPEATASIRDMVAGRVNKDLTNLEDRQRNVDDRQSCVQAHARLIFNWKGAAFACCPDIGEKLKLGDINTQSMEQIWKSKVALDLRKSLKDKTAFQKDPCKTCSSFESYSGFKPRWNS